MSEDANHQIPRMAGRACFPMQSARNTQRDQMLRMAAKSAGEMSFHPGKTTGIDARDTISWSS